MLMQVSLKNPLDHLKVDQGDQVFFLFSSSRGIIQLLLHGFVMTGLNPQNIGYNLGL